MMLQILTIFLGVASICNSANVYIRQLPREILLYALNDLKDFEHGVAGCARLGGQLPVVHNQRDLDFLFENIVMNKQQAVWLNMKRDGQMCKWLDDSPYDFALDWSLPCLSLDACRTNCCAVGILYRQGVKTVAPISCHIPSLQVCVISTTSEALLESLSLLSFHLMGEHLLTLPVREFINGTKVDLGAMIKYRNRQITKHLTFILLTVMLSVLSISLIMIVMYLKSTRVP